jgi:hypothetical protein
MKLVVVESPYAGATPEEIERNVRYARLAMADCLSRNEAPFASHLLYTQPGVLDDKVPEERKLGIEAGLQWSECASVSVFYIDLGWSPGMLAARERAEQEGRTVETRSIGKRVY